MTGAPATPNNDLLRQSTFVVSTAYCDAGNVNGKITYDAAASSPTVPSTLNWSLDVNLVCTHPPTTAGAPTLALGTYRVTANGTSSDTCSNGTGVGTVTGGSKTAGPEQGTILPGGLWQYRRAGIHYYGYPPNGDGNFVLVDQFGWRRLYRMYLWFDYVPPVGGSVCPRAGLNTLIGHAKFVTD